MVTKEVNKVWLLKVEYSATSVVPELRAVFLIPKPAPPT